MLTLSKRNAYFATAVAIGYFLVFGNFNQALKWVVIGVQIFNRKFPVVTDIILTIIGLYIVWRLLKILIRFWLNLIIATLKITLTVSLIFIAFAIYLRGMERLFTKDIPFLLSLARGDVEFFKDKFEYLLELAKFKLAGDTKRGFDASMFSKEYNHLEAPAKNFLMDQFSQLVKSVRLYIEAEAKSPNEKVFRSWRYK